MAKRGWCEHCHNTGELDCHCGGDLCVCLNYGTYECPHCDGCGDDDGDDIEMADAADIAAWREEARNP